MKKIVLLLAAVAAVGVAQAQHIEFKWHGFYAVAGYDYAFNFNKTEFEDKATFNGITAVAGYQIRKESGLGMGFSFMHDATGAFSQLPIFIELRSHYMRSRLTPYTSLYVGYSIPLGSSSAGKDAVQITAGGVTSGANIGVRYAFSRKFGMSVYVGYQELYMTKVQRKISGKIAETQPILFHNIKVGVGFNF